MVSLRQMLDHAREAVAMAGGKDRHALEHERMLHLALIRLIEVVGEAANRVPADIQLKHPAIPWSEVIGARHRLIHGYDNVDYGVLWGIVHADLPRLVELLVAVPDLDTGKSSE